MRAIAVLFVSMAPCLASDDAARGAALFSGDRPPVARIRGHADPLPADAARCSNCHGAKGGARPDAGQPFAPELTREYLLLPTARRGGPKSSYDEAAFCRALRSGVDPAWVTLQRAMPRYELDDAACSALWAHLTAAR